MIQRVFFFFFSSLWIWPYCLQAAFAITEEEISEVSSFHPPDLRKLFLLIWVIIKLFPLCLYYKKFANIKLYTLLPLFFSLSLFLLFIFKNDFLNFMLDYYFYFKYSDLPFKKCLYSGTHIVFRSKLSSRLYLWLSHTLKSFIHFLYIVENKNISSILGINLQCQQNFQPPNLYLFLNS